MDIQKIKQLIDLLVQSELAEIELVEGEHRVRLVRRTGLASADPTGKGSADPAIAPWHATPPDLPDQEARPAAAPARVSLIASPLFGVLHLRPSPNTPPYVGIGEQVQAGQTLCAVEAMKMFHEVKAEQAGKVVAILADAGEEVEAGQALFQLADAP
jgi:acetyl-CoA carboxylase biotin carboxyl carrier protein